MKPGRRFFGLTAISTILLFPYLSWAGTFTAFGPKTYVRASGAPVEIIDPFSVLNPNTAYTITIQNGGLEDGQFELVSSTVIAINGTEVVGPNEFNQNVTLVQKPVSLNVNNELSVEVRGKPGGAITISILGVDVDPPVISAALDSPPNSAGWHNQDVTVSFKCEDAISGIATCPDPVLVSSEGENQVITGTATDRAGNSATASVTVNLDKTPPQITPTTVPTPNFAGWNHSDVTVSFDCFDGLSGRASCTGPIIIGTEGASQLTEGEAVDIAGNTANSTVTVNLDKTPPVLSVTSPVNGSVTNQAQVTVEGSVSDAFGVSGLTVNGTPFGVENGSFSGPMDLSEGQNNLTVTVTDLADNQSTTIVGVIRDSIPPVISITSPANQSTTSQASVAVSGAIDDPTATVTVNGVSAANSGGAFSAVVSLGPGLNTLTATAQDPAGNTASDSVQVNRVTLTLDLVYPPDGSQFTTTPITVVGQVNDPSVTVTVNGNQVPFDEVRNTLFFATVSIVGGPNMITVVATDLTGFQVVKTLTVHLVDTNPPW